MHIAIIMDGNRRWAKKNKFKAINGHKQGALKLLECLDFAIKKKVKIVSAYTLSCENLESRNPLEIKALFQLIDSLFDKVEEINQKDGKIVILGDISKLPPKTQDLLQKAEQKTHDNSTILLQLCINYGGRQEILMAAEKLAKSNTEFTVANLENFLYTKNQPDLIIRTGGHQRFSNFLLWQSAYSEMYFTDTLWPDFGEKELEEAVSFYENQKRNFGK
jgi:undecaprenyl diphosphate synthase